MAADEKKGTKKTPWIRIYCSIRGGVDSMTDEQAGQLFKKILQYADQNGTGEEEILSGILDPTVKAFFCMCKGGVDESVVGYAAKVKGGKARAAQRDKELEEKNELIDKLTKLHENTGEDLGMLSIAKDTLGNRID